MRQVLVLGGNGMLGSMVTSVLCEDPELEVTATVRNEEAVKQMAGIMPKVKWVILDADRYRCEIFSGYEYIINCIGATKPRIKEKETGSIRDAIFINSLFPYGIHESLASLDSKATVIQIATDCVFAGVEENAVYTEKSFHNALDVYGKTKSLGEVKAENHYNLRCSIIGTEIARKDFLLEWFLARSYHERVSGYTNHFWNGITTLHFARICHAIIKFKLQLPGTQHIIPTGVVNKLELLSLIAKHFEKTGVDLRQGEGEQYCNRTLATSVPAINQLLWEGAGYTTPPTVDEMVKELAERKKQ